MVLENSYRVAKIFLSTWLWLVFYLILSISICYYEFGINVSFPNGEVGMIGTALSILMGFRVNSAYERWWEARIWGSIVNNSRSLAREVIGFTSFGEHAFPAAQQLIHRQIAFVQSTTRQLRRQQGAICLRTLVSNKEYSILEKKQHLPNALLPLHMQQIKELYEKKQIRDFVFVQLETIFTELPNNLGQTERIKNTPFPVPYSYFSFILVHIFACFFPFGMVKELGYLTIPISLIVTFIFLVIEQIAVEIQDPFASKDNDTPMTTISKSIEINLREMLGEENLPIQITPKTGVLM
ncbi:bestrophin family protein [Arcticibacter eurypsychrophilus]|uniref:bestrophin family protein n=1 Tax=Arcticibacter eurypsychrophilus TaxID=1434752 RepID=UPI00084CEA8A|nr:bestrophin family ion channel [Arcticibacter eurypsychrophilus]